MSGNYNELKLTFITFSGKYVDFNCGKTMELYGKRKMDFVKIWLRFAPEHIGENMIRKFVGQYLLFIGVPRTFYSFLEPVKNQKSYTLDIVNENQLTLSSFTISNV